MKKIILIILSLFALGIIVPTLNVDAETIPTSSVTRENAYAITSNEVNTETLSSEEQAKYENTNTEENGVLTDGFVFVGTTIGFDYLGNGENTDSTASEKNNSNTSTTSSDSDSESTTNDTNNSNESNTSDSGDMSLGEAFGHFSLNVEVPAFMYNLNTEIPEPTEVTGEEGASAIMNIISNGIYITLFVVAVAVLILSVINAAKGLFDDKKGIVSVIGNAILALIFLVILVNFPEFIAWFGDFVNNLASTPGMW